MKILRHVTYNTYRLLLRRDQVHKVVCNFLLTPEISFNQLATSDFAWIWAGMNHAEEQQCLEQLAIRFKTSELAKSFKEAIDNIQQTLSESREKDTQHYPVIEEPEDDENEEADEKEEGEEEEEEEDDDDDDKKSAAFDNHYVY